MNSKNIIFILSIIFILYKCSKNNQNIEKFIGHHPNKYCKSCGTKSRFQCNNCINCGYCFPNNRSRPECVPGDSRGPYFRKDCVGWEHGKASLPDYVHSAHVYPSFYTHPVRYWNNPLYRRRRWMNNNGMIHGWLNGRKWWNKKNNTRKRKR
jgi:hypothetical protein